MPEWYLITTKPHKDSYAEEQLNNQGYITYRPLVKYKKKLKGKLVEINESLFPRYLFIQLKEGTDDWSPIRSTRGVLNIVRFGLKPAKAPASLIEMLKDNERINQEKATHLSQFKAGDQVRIECGSFDGLEAVFEKYNGEERVIVLLNIIQQQAALELSTLDIVKVG
ncbi:MAG: transcription/translation regulatory transformer protein RfaH [Cocleimonas sp.]|nr:transcription/translation regulatory transformer protein RfaH [Cocleimonas sp.]